MSAKHDASCCSRDCDCGADPARFFTGGAPAPGPLAAINVTTAAVLYEVAAERLRQDEKWERSPGYWPGDLSEKLAVLGEEHGEVCRAVIEREGNERLREELIQVAAVAVAWAETLS